MFSYRNSKLALKAWCYRSSMLSTNDHEWTEQDCVSISWNTPTFQLECLIRDRTSVGYVNWEMNMSGYVMLAKNIFVSFWYILCEKQTFLDMFVRKNILDRFNSIIHCLIGKALLVNHRTSSMWMHKWVPHGHSSFWVLHMCVMFC